MSTRRRLQDTEVPAWMVEKGLRDPELEGAHLRAKPVPIFAEGKIIGWHAPRKEKLGWRVGAIYIDPAYRGQGHGKRVVREFFANRRAAPVPIREGNSASEASFRSAGFEPTDRRVEDDGWVGRWWERPEVKKKSGYTDLQHRILAKLSDADERKSPVPLWLPISKARKVFGSPVTPAQILGEAEELWEGVKNLDPANIAEEISDVGLFSQVWLHDKLGQRVNWPVILGRGSYGKFKARMDEWDRIFAQQGLRFDPKYLVKGGNPRKPEKVIAALEAGRIDQMKSPTTPSTKMSQWTKAALVQYEDTQMGHSKLSAMRPSPRVAHLLQKAGLVDRPAMDGRLKLLLGIGAGVAGAATIPPAMLAAWWTLVNKRNDNLAEYLAQDPTFQAARHANSSRFTALKGLSNVGGGQPVEFDVYPDLRFGDEKVHLKTKVDHRDNLFDVRYDARAELQRQRSQGRPTMDLNHLEHTYDH